MSKDELSGGFFVKLDDVMGNDLSVVNAARASFMREAEYLPGYKLARPDVGLIDFLARDNHESPYRQTAARLEVASTIRHRLLIESLLGNNRAGFVFKPDLIGLIADVDMEAEHAWRVTASLSGFVRMINAAVSVWTARRGALSMAGLTLADRLRSLLAPRFPYSIEALTGYATNQPHSIQPARGNGEMVNVLDKGYVRLIDWMDGVDDEERMISFEVKAPLMIRSQWFKYRRNSDHCPQQFVPIPWEELGTGNGDDGTDDPLYARNEASRRYVTLEPEFYIPTAWRSAPANRKQGSGDVVDEALNGRASWHMEGVIRQGLEYYEWALAQNIAPEQARIMLPSYALYTTWRWTASMDSVMHFLRQRLESDAQSEIRDYAQAVRALAEPVFPSSLRTLVKEA